VEGKRWTCLATTDLKPSIRACLSSAEREAILTVANAPRFVEAPPPRIVPILVDEGVYLASESTFHRVLRFAGQSGHRGRAKTPRKSWPPTTHIAMAPNQVWCWDMTFLPKSVRRMLVLPHLILDLYSRKVVGWEVQRSDNSDHAAHLVRRTALAESIHSEQIKPVLHGDNG
jgi:putative transposase